MKNWIENLKAGDQVIVHTNMGRVIRQVEKITPAGNIKLNNGTIFNKDGRERGGNDWNVTYLGEATPEIVKEIKEKHFIICVKKQLKEFLKKDLTIEQAQALFQIIKDNEKDEKNNN